MVEVTKKRIKSRRILSVKIADVYRSMFIMSHDQILDMHIQIPDQWIPHISLYGPHPRSTYIQLLFIENNSKVLIGSER